MKYSRSYPHIKQIHRLGVEPFDNPIPLKWLTITIVVVEAVIFLLLMKAI